MLQLLHSAISPNLRSDKQKKDLIAYNNKLKKYENEIVDGVLNKFPDLQKQPKTGVERVSVLRERMTQEQRENYWKLCINFLMSSSQFETFVNTNKLTRKLLEIGLKNAHEKDIAKLVYTLFNEFKLQLPSNLQEQMVSMFGMEVIKTIKVSHQK